MFKLPPGIIDVHDVEHPLIKDIGNTVSVNAMAEVDTYGPGIRHMTIIALRTNILNNCYFDMHSSVLLYAFRKVTERV